MKVRKLFALSMATILLTSCSNYALRSDIADFIASFSLDASIQAYKEAGYIETKVAEAKDETTKTVESFSFNVKDVTHPKYKKVTSTYKNEIFDSETKEEIIEENNKYYLVKNDTEKIEKTLEETHKLIELFFYKSVEYETIHLYGMYYGDYIKQIVTMLQSLVTIDTENDLYVYSATRTYLNDKNIKVYESQTYKVDRLGMLQENDLIRSTDELTVTTHIETYHV